MKMKSKSLYSFAIIVCAIMITSIFSCSHESEKHHTLVDKIHEESAHYEGSSHSSEEYLSEMNLIEVTEGEHHFLIPERKSEIKSFECTECHTKALDKMQTKDTKKAHWDINLAHANINTMECTTCHNSTDMDELKSLTGKTIDFNQSYQLCGQCHHKEFKDWKGGAHGKKIAGWAPPRASKTCVNCHNPHAPSFKSKWPERYNTQKVLERK